MKSIQNFKAAFWTAVVALSAMGLSSCSSVAPSGKNEKKKNASEKAEDSKEQKTPKTDKEKLRESIAKGVPLDPGVFFMNYPPRYCEHVWKLKLRADVSEELKYFCDGATPTEAMVKLRETLIQNPGKIEIKKIFSKADEKISEFTLVWGYYLPEIRPFRVKEKPLNAFIARNLNENIIDLKSATERLSDEGNDFGMHLWSSKMMYDLKLKAAEGIELVSKRATQYNLYQVESGNEEMGFGVETLTDGFGDHYQRSVMLNISFNDGQGYNDEVGGAVIMNMLHLKMSNRGFKETTEKSLDRLGLFFATSMYEGLTGKLK